MNIHSMLVNRLSPLIALMLMLLGNQIHAAPAFTTPGQSRLPFPLWNGSSPGSNSIGGKLFSDIGPSDDRGAAVAVQPDNKIVVAGFSDAEGDRNVAVVRYTTLGALDRSFGGDGIVLTDFGGNDQATAVAIQADGKIVVVGASDAAGSTDFALARYLPNGDLDSSFDGDGKLTSNVGGESEDQARAVILQADGKIVVAGGSCTIDNCNFDATLVRYTTSGSLDTSFGGDGIVTTAFGVEGMSAAYGLALMPDGKLVAVGQSTDNGDIALARYTSSGVLDSAFNGDGKLTTDLGGNDRGAAVITQADSKIVVAGASDAGSSTDFILARYTANGSLDPTFDVDGRLVTDFFGGEDQAFALARQPDNKLVAAGFAQRDGAMGFAVARYQNGTLAMNRALYLPLVRKGP